jgi:uncharacterized DUF497 family protein
VAIAFEWDPDKAERNLAKHGVSFPEATTVFADALSLTVVDEVHSQEEARFVTMGASHRHRLLVVVHVDVGNEIHLISAREATRAERRQYEEESP